MAQSIAALRAALEGVATTRGRVGVSVGLAVAAAAVALLVVPRVVDWLGGVLTRIAFGEERAPEIVEDGRWIATVRTTVRLLQVTTVVALGMGLLLVWGYVDVAVAVAGVTAQVLPEVGRVVATVALLGGAVVGTDLLESWIASYAEGSDRINEHQREIVFRVLQVVLLIAAGMAVLAVWQFNLGGLLVGAGFLGIVVGMAARQTLGSLIAGFVLMFSRPFELGDWVIIENSEGIVTDITIVNTRLRNFDGETIVIPNDRVSNSTIRNRSDRDRLRLRLDVGVDYDADVERAEAVATEALGDVENVLDIPSPQVVPKAFGDSAVTLELRFWIDNPTARRRWRAQAAVVRAVKAAFEREGIKIPFPQRELAGRAEEGGFRVTEGSVGAVEPDPPPGED